MATDLKLCKFVGCLKLHDEPRHLCRAVTATKEVKLFHPEEKLVVNVEYNYFEKRFPNLYRYL
jgi:hypothetical protein